MAVSNPAVMDGVDASSHGLLSTVSLHTVSRGIAVRWWTVVGIFGLVWSAFLNREAKADIIIDNFENQPVASGAGTPLNYFTFGDLLSDRGVSNTLGSVSGTRSAFYVVDFDQSGFGVGAARQNLNLSIDPKMEVMVELRLAAGPRASGFIAFRLEDADGTIFRTADNQLLAASSSFQTLSQSIATILTVDTAGSIAGLDLTQIRSVGLLFFDRDFTGLSTIVFDDLRIVTVPEPSVLSLLALAFGILLPVRCRSPRSR